ncbi:hypothetical protein PENTCL1PPCAC_24623, partial [Pristionchus entomophagus]
HSQIVCGIVCIIPSLLLLTAVVRSSIHTNCRIMMCLWILSQLLVYATVCWLSVSSIILDEHYFKDSFDINGLSIRNPLEYHASATAYEWIIIYFVCSQGNFRNSSILLNTGAETLEATMGGILSNILDIGAFVTNVIVMIFARRKDAAEHKQLNERYQIRETYLVARAMMPVYCASTVLKVTKRPLAQSKDLRICSVNQVLYISVSRIKTAQVI